MSDEPRTDTEERFRLCSDLAFASWIFDHDEDAALRWARLAADAWREMAT